MFCREAFCSVRYSAIRFFFLAFVQAGDAHRQLQRLLVVQSRIDLRLVGAREIRVGETAGAARALGDVFTGQLEVHAAEPRAELAVNAERGFELR